MSTFFSITLTLFFVIDALGNVPIFLYLIKPYDKKKQRRIALRELVFALIIMFFFHFFGEFLLSILGVTAPIVRVSGGIVLFLIAIRLIFSNDEEKPKWKEQVPFIVPIATPMIAGPSVLAVIMIFAQDIHSTGLVLGAIFTAWALSSLIFLFAKPIYQLVKEKGLNAAQRLMGLIVALIAVQLFIDGVSKVLK